MRGDRIPPWRRQNSATPEQPIESFLDGAFATPEDTSEPGCRRRYSCFVMLTAFVTSAVLLAPLMLHLERQRQRSRASLLRDLQRSRDHGVHPCDDFYRHVCSGWDGNLNRPYRTPLATYSSAFDERVIMRCPASPVSLAFSQGTGQGFGASADVPEQEDQLQLGLAVHGKLQASVQVRSASSPGDQLYMARTGQCEPCRGCVGDAAQFPTHSQKLVNVAVSRFYFCLKVTRSNV
ncbi:uncharacterized protein [Dermacentor albipictus]|uniref:uncharacterized protein isoform X3 n=1 Tax=Dermacentor albipictus TaxID=60249 RepID=UPI0038FC32B2